MIYKFKYSFTDWLYYELEKDRFVRAKLMNIIIFDKNLVIYRIRVKNGDKDKFLEVNEDDLYKRKSIPKGPSTRIEN